MCGFNGEPGEVLLFPAAMRKTGAVLGKKKTNMMARNDGVGFACEACVQTSDRLTSLTNRRQDGRERGGKNRPESRKQSFHRAGAEVSLGSERSQQKDLAAAREDVQQNTHTHTHTCFTSL